jgi:hypothetical protein
LCGLVSPVVPPPPSLPPPPPPPPPPHDPPREGEGELTPRASGLRVSGAGQVRMFTARAMTSPRIINEIRACAPIVNLAQCRSGMTSVGLNAVALVRPR